MFEGKKRFRKPKLKAREDAENDYTFMEVQQKRPRLQSYPEEDHTYTTPPSMEVKIEVEEVDETTLLPSTHKQKHVTSVDAVPKEPKPTDTIIVSKIKIEKIFKVSERISCTSTNIADQILGLEMKNYWGHVLTDESVGIDDPYDKKIQRALMYWSGGGLAKSRMFRDTPICYQCHICNRAWWFLAPFREHIRSHDLSIYVTYHEFPKNFTSILIASNQITMDCVNTKAFKYIPVEGNCLKCGKDGKEHKMESSKFLQCNIFFMGCAKLRHIEDKAKEITCRICFCTFYTMEELRKHILLSHMVRSDIPVLALLQYCATCNKTYSKHLFVSHYCMTHPKKYGCKYCYRRFYTMRLLSVHYAVMKTNFPCEICNKVLACECQLSEHMIKHTDLYMTVYRCTAIGCMPNLVMHNYASARRHRYEKHYAEKKNYVCQVIVPKQSMKFFLKAIEHSRYNSAEITDGNTMTGSEELDRSNILNMQDNIFKNQELLMKQNMDKLLQVDTSGGEQDCTIYERMLSNLMFQGSVGEVVPEERINIKVEPIDEFNEYDDDGNLSQIDIEENNIKLEPNFDEYNEITNIDENEITNLDQNEMDNGELCDNIQINNVLSLRDMLLVSRKSIDSEPEVTSESGAGPSECGPKVPSESGLKIPRGSRSKGPSQSGLKVPGPSKSVPKVPSESGLKAPSESGSKGPSQSGLKGPGPSKSGPKVPSESGPKIPRGSGSKGPTESGPKVPSETVTEELDNIPFQVKIEPVDEEDDLVIDVTGSDTSENTPKVTSENKPDEIVNKTVPEQIGPLLEHTVLVEKVLTKKKTSIKMKRKVKVKKDAPKKATMEKIPLKVYSGPHAPDQKGEQIPINIKIEPCGIDESNVIVVNVDSEVLKAIKEESQDEECLNILQNMDTDNKVPVKKKYQRDPTKTPLRFKRKMYTCRKCGYTDRHKLYKKHLLLKCQMESKGNGYYPCTKCNKSFSSLNMYAYHFVKHGYKVLSCFICDEQFEYACPLALHVNKHFRQNYVKVVTLAEETTTKKNVCQICKELVSQDQCFIHWEQHLVLKNHIKEEPKEEEPKRVRVETPTIDHSKTLSPDKMVIALDVLETDNKIKICAVCDRFFSRRNECKRHLIEHLLLDSMAKKTASDRTLRCQICNKGYKSQDAYKYHMREHAGLPAYRCNLCDKTFSDSSNFCKHKKVHDVKALVCDICKKKFQSKRMLIKHLIMHENTGTLMCKYCSKMYFCNTMLKKHEKTHTSGIRVKCTLCDMYFNTLKAKWDHAWQVHGDRKMDVDCPLCDQQFRKYLDLKKHVKDIHRALVVRRYHVNSKDKEGNPTVKVKFNIMPINFFENVTIVCSDTN